MSAIHCPKCDADISDTFEGDDWSVGIIGGWYCDACDLGLAEHEVGYDPLPDDVPLAPAEPRTPTGTPLSQLRGRPDGTPEGDAMYENFKRIARSWGYD